MFTTLTLEDHFKLFIRCREKQNKPKRRIAPTPVNPQKPATQSPLFGSSSAWEEPDCHHAFTSSHTELSSDLSKALDEDRRQIQREIASQRHKHAINKKKKESRDLEAAAEGPEGIEHRALIDSDRKMEVKAKDGHSAKLCTSVLDCSLPATESQHNPCVSDPSFLDQLAHLYSEIIRGMCVGCVENLAINISKQTPH